MEKRNRGSLYPPRQGSWPRAVTLSRSAVVSRGESSTNYGLANRKETVVRPSSLVAGKLSPTRNKRLLGYCLQILTESPRVILHCFSRCCFGDRVFFLELFLILNSWFLLVVFVLLKELKTAERHNADLLKSE